MGTTSNGTAVTPSIGGLANGDICDSNTFLNYVLNQQRSNGIFLFDPTRSLPSGAEANDSQLSYMQQQKQLGNSVTRDTKHSISPSIIPPVEGNPPRRDAATNTMPHYVPFHHDSKVAIDTCSNENLTICRGTNQCARCAALKMPHTCQMDGVSNSQGSPVLSFSAGVNERGTDVMNTSNAVAGNNKVYGNSIVLNNQAHFQECNSCSCNCAGQSCVDLSTSSFSGGKLGAGTLPSGGHKAPTSGSKCNSTECKVKDPGIHYVEANRSFTCDVCFKTYPTSTALMNHMRYHRGQRPYQCEICNKAFATNSHLVTHRRVHTGERPFQCRLCRRSFADRSAHVKHERTHGPNGTIIRRYKCDECGNSFVDSCGLKKHLRIHTGERPYCCSVCQKTFSTSSTFVAHKRIHSGERPYKCESCDKMFITKSHLLTHRRTHTGEKPFSCPVCSRAFADGSSFRRHERLHTGENRHTCDICGKGFPFDSSLAKHKQSHIPGTPTFVCMM